MARPTTKHLGHCRSDTFNTWSQTPTHRCPQFPQPKRLVSWGWSAKARNGRMRATSPAHPPELHRIAIEREHLRRVVLVALRRLALHARDARPRHVARAVHDVVVRFDHAAARVAAIHAELVEPCLARREHLE